MIVISGERRILIGIFTGDLAPAVVGRRIMGLGELADVEVSAVYFDNYTRQVIPDLLVIDTPNLREFFAWSSTYLPHWSPLSSSIRIIERRQSNTAISAPSTYPRKFLRGLLCLSLGELLYEWRLAHGQPSLNMLSVQSTFGYAATCAVINNRFCLNDLLSKWMRAQHLIQVHPRRLNSTTLKSVWAPVFAVLNSGFGLEKPAVTASELGSYIAHDSQRVLFRSQDLNEEVPRRRELIVVELERLVRETKLVDSSECFEAAFVASQMSTNPLSHFDVLGEITSSEPRTLLWYSFLSGMFASDPASPALERVLFQLESNLRVQPSLKTDILLEELEALIGPDGQIPDEIGIGARFINVEIDYGVCASFRTHRETSQDQIPATRLDEKQQLANLLEQLRLLFERSNHGRPDGVAKAKSEDFRRRKKR